MKYLRIPGSDFEVLARFVVDGGGFNVCVVCVVGLLWEGSEFGSLAVAKSISKTDFLATEAGAFCFTGIGSGLFAGSGKNRSSPVGNSFTSASSVCLLKN